MDDRDGAAIFLPFVFGNAAHVALSWPSLQGPASTGHFSHGRGGSRLPQRVLTGRCRQSERVLKETHWMCRVSLKGQSGDSHLCVAFHALLNPSWYSTSFHITASFLTSEGLAEKSRAWLARFLDTLVQQKV